MDLIDMQQYTNTNKGTRYLFTIIDVFSKYAFVFPLKNKKGITIAYYLEKLFYWTGQYSQIPLILLSDNSGEFINTSKVVINIYEIKRYGNLESK